MADAATGDELWFGDELLAKTARLARGGDLATDPLRLVRLASASLARSVGLGPVMRAEMLMAPESLPLFTNVNSTPAWFKGYSIRCRANFLGPSS